MTSGSSHVRARTPDVPTRRERLRWYGPGLLWMISSVGSGSVLFTPRVGSRYGYEMLWAALVIIVLMWVMIREVGRYTVVTGRTILAGYRDLPGPRGWAIWLILVPGLVAGTVVIAGVAALAASAVVLAVPGSQGLHATIIIVVSAAIVLWGRYRGVERVTVAMSGVLLLSVVVTAVVVGPDLSELGRGLVPGLPSDLDWYFVLPWIGFILAGSGGILWFSYWVAARGYGGAVTGDSERQDAARTEVVAPDELVAQDDPRRERLAGWVRVMSATAAIGVATGGLVIVSFLILGAELLRPEGIVPEGIDVAEDLARLLGDVWGTAGRWVLIVSVVIALWGTVVSNQDGWPRTYADAVLMLQGPRDTEPGHADADRAPERGWRRRLRERGFLHRAGVVVTVTIAPLVVFWLVRDPVSILSIGGIVTAAHTPVLVGLTLYVNHRHLPVGLRPGRAITGLMVLAGLIFSGFAVLYFSDLLGVPLL